MRNYIKTTAGLVLSATMATASAVNVGELQGFTGPLESMIGPMSGGANLAVTEANASGKYLQGTITVVQGDSVCINAAVAMAAPAADEISIVLSYGRWFLLITVICIVPDSIASQFNVI